MCVIQTILFAVLAQLSLQEVFSTPSRISMQDLCRKYHLPSTLSKYESLPVPNRNGPPSPIGVHYLKYTKNEEVQGPSLVDAIVVHHGFGASSLSWLPALPSLVNRLGARVGLGHDMVGFGFTDRQQELEWYTTEASARISQAVFNKETSHHRTPPTSVALLGHSLGAIGALKMALRLPRETAKVVVLCAPALGLSGKFSEKQLSLEGVNLFGLKHAVGAFVRKTITFPLAGYILRRIVG